MPRLTRRSLLLGATAAPFAAPLAQAQSWPSGPIKIIVPFPPGGTVDPIARLAQPALQQRLGVPVVIENKPGASGSIGAGLVAKSPPDGTTWLFVFDTQAVNPFLQDLPFDTVRDLDPVLLIGTAPNVLCRNPARPYETPAQLFAAAKAKPDSITFASVGSGSLGHLTMVLLTQKAGVRMVHVPYRGGGPAMNDAIAGHVDLIIASAALISPQVAAKKIIPVLQTGKTRLASMPETETAIEAGFAGFESYAWWGVFAPGGTPRAIIDRFAAELADALRAENVARQLRDNLSITLLLAGPEAQRDFLAAQMALWGPVVRENNIKGE